MEINKETENGVLTVYMKGKLDTVTAPQAEKEITADLENAGQLVLDMKELKYLSSAGLRLILKLHKTMKDRDGMIIKNANESILEVFDLTGFSDLLQIE